MAKLWQIYGNGKAMANGKSMAMAKLWQMANLPVHGVQGFRQGTVAARQQQAKQAR